MNSGLKTASQRLRGGNSESTKPVPDQVHIKQGEWAGWIVHPPCEGVTHELMRLFPSWLSRRHFTCRVGKRTRPSRDGAQGVR